MAQVTLFNDTSTRYHHGCARVMRLLGAGLEARGAQILARSPARHDWAADADLLAQIRKSDILVINGEGTLHHGAKAGRKLLDLADHPATQGKKLVLINALYDANPPEWADLLKRFDLISARDSDSASQLSQAIGRTVGWAPDLSLSHPADTSASKRAGVIFGDSVRMNRRRELAAAHGRFENATFVPTKTLRQPIWRLPVIGQMAKWPLYSVYNGTLKLPRRFEMPLDEQSYLERLAACELHITGRFHAVCLSLLTRTPFLALTSTSGKIEKLLKDLDLPSKRIVNGQDLMQLPPSPEAHQFDKQERAQINSALAFAQTRNAALLDEVLA